MEILVTIVYVAVCLFLILVVLLQSGKAGDLASTFGGASSQTAFGSRGTANLLSKATTVCASLFLVLALLLAIVSHGGATSRLSDVEDTAGTEQQQAAPAETAPAAAEEPAPDATPTPADNPADSGTTDDSTGNQE